MRRHYNIFVHGKVQGVNYRANAQATAHLLNLTGYVKNLPKTGVYIEVEGPEEGVNKFIEWCYTGPKLAIVTEVKAEEAPLVGFQTFEIKR
ncbi:MAG: acyP [Bacteroidetes bacterium]|nr:acyP [Bacteroidota bacterium]